jgi:hypothetical protein
MPATSFTTGDSSVSGTGAGADSALGVVPGTGLGADSALDDVLGSAGL